jgi:hypothetical protein
MPSTPIHEETIRAEPPPQRANTARSTGAPANGYQELKRDALNVFDAVTTLVLVYGFIVLIGAIALVTAALVGVAVGLLVLLLGGVVFYLGWKKVVT